MKNDRLTFDDVMLDWAVAELLSPTRAADWAGPACDELRRKVQNADISSLTIHERTWLVEAVVQIRRTIIAVYGPCRSWSFRRTFVPYQEISAFSIIDWFGYPTFSFGDLAAKIKDNPSERERGVRDAVTMILAQTSGGKQAFGLPIAITRKALMMPPLLVEGYKRSMAVLWSGQAVPVEMFLCTP
jgi:hypothetical protein